MRVTRNQLACFPADLTTSCCCWVKSPISNDQHRSRSLRTAADQATQICARSGANHNNLYRSRGAHTFASRSCVPPDEATASTPRALPLRTDNVDLRLRSRLHKQMSSTRPAVPRAPPVRVERAESPRAGPSSLEHARHKNTKRNPAGPKQIPGPRPTRDTIILSPDAPQQQMMTERRGAASHAAALAARHALAVTDRGDADAAHNLRARVFGLDVADRAELSLASHARRGFGVQALCAPEQVPPCTRAAAVATRPRRVAQTTTLDRMHSARPGAHPTWRSC